MNPWLDQALMSHLRRSENSSEVTHRQAHDRNRELASGQAARPISIGQLHALQRFHLRPINLLVWKGPLGAQRPGYLILGWASRLYAFSGYPVRTWLPGYAAGATTDTPAVRSSRSSRTKDNTPQVSCAHGG